MAYRIAPILKFGKELMTETVIETSSLTQRYEPAEDPQAVPFNVLPNAGESVTTTRRFTLAADARDPG